MTPKQHKVLSRLSDEQWRHGVDLDTSATVLATLSHKGFIRGADFGVYGMLAENWVITPDGLHALEAVA